VWFNLSIELWTRHVVIPRGYPFPSCCDYSVKRPSNSRGVRAYLFIRNSFTRYRPRINTTDPTTRWEHFPDVNNKDDTPWLAQQTICPINQRCQLSCLGKSGRPGHLYALRDKKSHSSSLILSLCHWLSVRSPAELPRGEVILSYRLATMWHQKPQLLHFFGDTLYGPILTFSFYFFIVLRVSSFRSSIFIKRIKSDM
jgi:hypothetical protein